MCGIFFSYSKDKPYHPSKECLGFLQRRGPDSASTVSRSHTVSSRNSSCHQGKASEHLVFVSTVLSLRGEAVVPQPLEHQFSGSLMCWNGEAWKIGDSTVNGNDAQRIFDLLLECTVRVTYEQALQKILNLLANIAGPFAFVFYDAQHDRVFYGRDALGRRSLVFSNSLPGTFVVCSICDVPGLKQWTEVEADGIYMLDVKKITSPFGHLVASAHFPWTTRKQSDELTPTLVRRTHRQSHSLKTLTNSSYPLSQLPTLI